jgi:hypothetical protein
LVTVSSLIRRLPVVGLALLVALMVVPAALATSRVGPSPIVALPNPGPTVWGCFPGRLPDPCEGSLVTSVLTNGALSPPAVRRVDSPVDNPNAGVDCFYVYPTVTNALALNAPKHIDHDVQAILQSQAARYSQVCKVYAPIYRQATLASIVGGYVSGSQTPSKSLNIAYSDVVGAWKDYLANDNDGRGFILVGHSQGSALLIRLIREQIDNDPALRARMVGAILPGGNLTVLRNQEIGGDFQHVPLCTAQGQDGCAVAFSTYDHYPSRTSFFGRTSGLGPSFGAPVGTAYEAACTNPATLSGHGETLDEPLNRSSPIPGTNGIAQVVFYAGILPHAETPWVSRGDRYQADCEYHNGAHILEVRAASQSTIAPNAFPWSDWGLHVGEVAMTLGNLVEIMQAQTATYLAQQQSVAPTPLAAGSAAPTPGSAPSFRGRVHFRDADHINAPDLVTLQWCPVCPS